ncbi:hypothetical protein KM043_007114 [Ampulex compressa]|nr:hypothetical protein KM043_007114 [Ampulex compressa]
MKLPRGILYNLDTPKVCACKDVQSRVYTRPNSYTKEQSDSDVSWLTGWKFDRQEAKSTLDALCAGLIGIYRDLFSGSTGLLCIPRDAATYPLPMLERPFTRIYLLRVKAEARLGGVVYPVNEEHEERRAAQKKGELSRKNGGQSGVTYGKREINRDAEEIKERGQLGGHV